MTETEDRLIAAAAIIREAIAAALAARKPRL